MRAELLERYRALPLPTTRDEHWRFTDLAGFDPDAWSVDATSAPAIESLLELDVAASATIDESGITLSDPSGTPGVTFEALTDDHPLLGSLVKPDDKLRAHNAAVWQHGLLVHVAAGVELDKPLYLRVASGVPGGSVFWRVLVVAEPGARFTRRPGADVGRARARRVPERRRRGRSSATARRRRSSTCSASPRRPGSSPRATPASSGTPSSTGSRGASAPRVGRSGSRTTSPTAARRRASPAPTSPTGRSTSTTTRTSSTRPRTRPRTSPSRARSATRRPRCGAG